MSTPETTPAPAPADPATLVNGTTPAVAGMADAFAAGILGSLGAPAAQPDVPAQPAQPTPPSAPPPTPPPAPPVQPAQPAPHLDPSKIASRFLDPEAAAAAAAARPAPAAPAAPEEPEPDPSQFTKPDGTPDKAAHAYAKLRHDAKKYEREAAEARARAETLEAERKRLAEEKAALAAEKQRVEQERDKLSDDLGRVSLAESPKFKRKYSEREGEIASRLARVLTKFAGESPETAAAKAREWLALPQDALQEKLDDLHPSVSGAVLTAASEFAALDEERRQEITEWRRTAAALGIEEARQGVIRTTDERRRIAESALDAAKKVGNPVFSASGEEAEARALAVADAFRGFVQTATDEQLAHAAAEGFTAPLLYEALDEQAVRIRELSAELDAYKSAERVPLFPSLGRQPPPAAPAAVPAGVIQSPEGPASLAERAAAEAVAAFRRSTGPAPG